jgi:hypothetical protein
MSSLLSRAHAFLLRRSPFGREQGNEFDALIAQFVAGDYHDDPNFAHRLNLLLRLARDTIGGFTGERQAYLRDLVGILESMQAALARTSDGSRGERAEFSPSASPAGGPDMQGESASARWTQLLPPSQPPSYVQRAANEHERHLLKLLAGALENGLENGLRQFDEYYASNGSDSVAWDTRLGDAIHEFASETDYFETREEWRKASAILYGPDELRERILRLLALAAGSEP